MNAQEVLANLRNRYATGTSYRDLGYVYSWDESLQKTDKPQIVFRTYFERPSKFRFEWQDEDNKCVIWCDGNESYNCSDLYDSGLRKERCESVMMAIAGATGVSSGTANLVSSLLFDEMREHPDRSWFLLRSDVELKGTDEIEGHECYCIQGSNHSFNDTTIWVSKHDFSLRRHKSYVVRDVPNREIVFSAKKQSTNETTVSDGAILISVQRPRNLISDQEAREFMELFGQPTGLVEKRDFGEFTQAKMEQLQAGKWRGDSYFTEITYETVEFDSSIQPLTFCSIRRA